MLAEVKKMIKAALPKAVVNVIRSARCALYKPHNPYVDVSNNTLQAYRCYDGQVEIISSVIEDNVTPLSNGLMQRAGFFQVDGAVFDLRRDGIYRFYRLPTISEQRMVCSGGADSFLRMAGYLWLYGGRDDRSSQEDIDSLSTNRIICCACANTARFAARILEKMDVPVRLAACMSQNPWGGQDDGHTLLEIFMDDGWIAYDPAFNCLFYMNGKPVSLMAITVAGMERVNLHRLPGNSGYGGYAVTGYDYDFWVAERLLSEDILRQWYDRVMVVPLIYAEEKFAFPESFVKPENKDRFLRFYVPFSDDAFAQKFYGSVRTD